jgi:sterol desaturase/sphingolipid hydroxylase (fatty acid hydroxylase superfamily)
MYSVIVSPTFHAFHHSTDPAHYNRNYGKILSVWDFLFDTAVRGGERPVQFGVEGMKVPERLAAQFAHPFRLLWRWGRQQS